jgi:hypothetical protein
MSIYTLGNNIERDVDILMGRFLTQNTTVNLNSGMSRTTIQGLIDEQPKNLGGYTLTFQFADGTYAFGTLAGANRYGINFYGFYGGRLNIYGNVSENAGALHTNQAVIISTTSTLGSAYSVHVANCKVDCFINNIRVNATALDDTDRGIVIDNTSYAEVYGCYVNWSNTFGQGIVMLNGTQAAIAFNYITSGGVGIMSALATLLSNTNSGVTTNPRYGLYTVAGLINKYTTQPEGTTANELSVFGGEIR